MKRENSRILQSLICGFCILAGGFCVFAAALFLTACANGIQSGESSRPGKISGPENGADKEQDNLEGTGKAPGNDAAEEGKEPGEERGKIDGENAKAAEGAAGISSLAAGSFLAAEEYQEKGIENPPDIEERGETYSGTLRNEKQEIVLITFCPWMDTGGAMLNCYTLNEDGKSWESQPLTWADELKGKVQQNRIRVLFGEDQKYYAYYCDEEQLYHMVRQEGDGCEEIWIADWGDLETHKYYVVPGEVKVLANGNIVMVDTVGNGYIYSPNGADILAEFDCGWCETLYVSGNEIFVLDRGSGSILHYDGAELERMPSIEGNFNDKVRLSIFENTLFACSPEGIFAAELSAKEDVPKFYKWLDAGKFHFSKQNGYPLKLYSFGETFYITYAEEWGRIKKYVPKEEGEFASVLTIYSLENSELVIDMAAEFQQLHPEIEVRYETGEGVEGSTLAADRIRALNARLLAGEGPDILILDGLPAQSYVKKEILADLSTVLSGIREDLQENIVSNYVQGDKIYMLPLRFSIPMIATSGQNVEIFGSLAALTEYCEAEEGNQVVMPGVLYSQVLELLYYNFPPEIVGENGEINEDNIVDFIRQAKRFCEAEQAVPEVESDSEIYRFNARYGLNGYFSGSTLSGYYMGDQSIAFLNMAGIYGLSTYPREVEIHGGALLGNKGIFFPNGVIGVNADSKEKEAAFLFIKEAFSYDMQQVHSSNAGFSLHKKVLLEDAQLDLSYATFTFGKEEWETLHYFNKKDAKQMIQIAQVVQIPVEPSQPVFEVVRDAVCACLRAQISEQEAAREIVERLRLYYFE